MDTSPKLETRTFKEALHLSRSGDITSAKRVFDHILRESKDVKLLCLIGYEYLRYNQNETAMDCFNRAIQFDEQCSPAWGGLGRSLMELERWDEAEAAFRRRLELGENANHYVFLAMVLLCQSKYDDVLRCCDRALQLDDHQVDALLNQSRAYSLLGRHYEALEACRRALSIDDEYDEAHICYGVSLSEANREEEASDAFQRAIDINPLSAAAYREFGLFQRSSGDPMLANSYLRAALDLEDRNRNRGHETGVIPNS